MILGSNGDSLTSPQHVDLKAPIGRRCSSRSPQIQTSFEWIQDFDGPLIPIPLLIVAHLIEIKGKSKGTSAGGGYEYQEASANVPKVGNRDHLFNARASELRKLGFEPEAAIQEMRRLLGALRFLLQTDRFSIRRLSRSAPSDR
jgi:hypothetical protein